jgi:hypothetical protein
VDSSWTHQQLYRIAFVEADEPTMQREIDRFKGKPQAKATLSLGQIRRSPELFERARVLSLRQGRKETAVSIINGQAQFDADTGIKKQARAPAELSLQMMPRRRRQLSLLANIGREPNAGRRIARRRATKPYATS